jgi:signal transduction histidine kinase
MTEKLAARESALQEATSQAQKANESKSMFLANMSHELRTPMHAIMAFSDLGLRKISDEEAQSYFSKINVSGQRLTKLLNSLLDLAKLEAGMRVIDLDEYDLTEIIQHHIDEVDGLRRKKMLTINFEGQGMMIGVFDNVAIGQVITNLLSNAIKFSPQGDTIGISVTEIEHQTDADSQQFIRIAVTDNGVGIPEEELEEVFDKFVQSSKTTTNAGGTGLGLSISREIVRCHHGRIWAESPVNKQTQRGTTFFVEIPRRQLAEKSNCNNQ